MIDAVYLDEIKRFEGFSEVAKWDYAQYTNGYGTRAAHPGEKISREEADRRFRVEIEDAARLVEKHAAHWDAGTKAALTSLTFNAGTAWIKSGLGDAVRAGDAVEVRQRFLQYTRAGGEVLNGLVSRRMSEVAWIGGPTQPDAAAGVDAMVRRPGLPISDTPAVSRATSAGGPVWSETVGAQRFPMLETLPARAGVATSVEPDFSVIAMYAKEASFGAMLADVFEAQDEVEGEGPGGDEDHEGRSALG